MDIPTRPSPFPTRSTMAPADAMAAFFQVLQAMQAVVDLARLDTLYGDAQQNMAWLLQCFLAPLSDVYVSLEQADAPQEETP